MCGKRASRIDAETAGLSTERNACTPVQAAVTVAAPASAPGMQLHSPSTRPNPPAPRSAPRTAGPAGPGRAPRTGTTGPARPRGATSAVRAGGGGALGPFEGEREHVGHPEARGAHVGRPGGAELRTHEGGGFG